MEGDTIKMGIDGFGRTGGFAATAALRRDRVELVAINDGVHTPEFMAYVCKYEFNYLGEVEVKDDKTILFDGKPVTVLNYRDPEDIPWGKIGVYCVVDTTGRFTDKDRAKAHLKGGAKKVIIARSSMDAPTFVYGVNHLEYTPDLDIISNASSITNCVAPIVKILHDSFGISVCNLKAFHSTSDIRKTAWTPNRSASFRLVLPSSGEGMDIGQVIPALKGKVTLEVFDLPTTGVSTVFINVELDNPATYDEIKEAILEESEGNLMGILSFVDNGLPAADDIVGRSCIFDAKAGIAHSDKVFELVVWHDNDWGYSNRLIDLIKHMASPAHG